MADEQPPTPATNELLEAALVYARRGWPVVPLHTPLPDGTCDCRSVACKGENPPIGKHPRLRDGLKGASTDEAKIREWWKTWPHANVGVRTGEIAPGRFLSVLDVDPEKGGVDALEDLTRVHGALPETWHSLTGGGGDHYAFEGPEPMKTTSGALARGLDTRGGGGPHGAGYIVAPPSLHKSGRRYALEASSPKTRAEPPAWLLSLANGPGARSSSGEQAPSDVGERITDGAKGGAGRKKTLLSIGRTMRARGLGAEEIFASLRVTNELRCDPPLDEKDVRRMAEQAAKVPPGRSPNWQPRVIDGGRAQPDPDAPPVPPDTPEDPQGGWPTWTGNEEREAPGGTPLRRGDSVELARLVLDELAAGSGEPLVHDRGAFWRYCPERGVWEQLPAALLYCAVSSYAGRTVPGSKGPTSLKLSDGAIAGAIRAAAQFAAQPGFFNDAPEGLAFANGFVTVCDRCGPFVQSHAAEHRAIHALPFDYDPSAPAPRWERFLREIWTYPGEAEMPPETRAAIDADRGARVALLEEWVGAALLGFATRLAVCLVLTGEGNNGKSVLLQVVRALFPPAATVSVAPQLWENRFYLAELAGVRLNAVAEMPEREIQESEAFKAVVAGDELMVARKHERPFTLRPTAGHLVACNALPGTKDQTEGFWRRFEVLAFDRVFAEHERDLRLGDHLVGHELPGIAARMLAGAGRVLRAGRYTRPESSAHAKDEWRRTTDSARQFVEECCAVTDGTEGASLVQLYMAFALWARRTGHEGMARNALGNALRRLGHFHRTKVARLYALRVLPAVQTEVDRARR